MGKGKSAGRGRRRRRDAAARREADVRALIGAHGMVLRTTRPRSGVRGGLHWMFERRGERVMDYWPGTGTCWRPGWRAVAADCGQAAAWACGWASGAAPGAAGQPSQPPRPADEGVPPPTPRASFMADAARTRPDRLCAQDERNLSRQLF